MMGTRADFYVGRERGYEWLGSVEWDDYPEDMVNTVFSATDEASYRAAVAALVSILNRSAEDYSYAYAYAFDEDRVRSWRIQKPWRPFTLPPTEGGEK